MRALCLAVLVLGVASASAGNKQKIRPKVIDRVAVIVDGEPIFQSDVTRHGKLTGAPEAAEDELITETLILREARRLMVTVDDAEVDAAIQEVATQNGLDLAGLEAAIGAQGATLAEYKIDLRTQLAILRTSNVMFGGKIPMEEQEAALQAWIEEQRAHAYLEHPGRP